MTPTRTRTYAKRRWNVADASDRAADLGRALGTTNVTAQILINRGFEEADTARAFLAPTLRDLHDPSLLPGVPAAAERLARAIRDKEPIVIYGDYDVDGITASSILWHSIKALGHTARCYVPHRIEEGYGVNVDAIRQLCDEGAQLIVTVDCGITAVDPVAIARERGVDVIVTDHHEWKTAADGETILLPAATAIVHPRLPNAASPYPNPHLCGAGVAFKLAWGVGQMMGSGYVGPGARVPESMKYLLVEMTALAALGTIADVVPLVGENRALARRGLIDLKASKLNGIRALIAACDLDGKKLDSLHVGFLIGPRLNAAGRMGHARLAVEMLTEASPQRADEIATYLEGQNRERQTTERAIVLEAIRQAEELGLCEDGCHAIVVGSAGWHPGVIGIVASRLVDRFHKPAIVIALGEDHGHGSGRSIAGFHLAKALDACKPHLKTCGGHEMAAGLGIEPNNLPAFRAAFLDYAKTNLSAEQLVPQLRIDTIARLSEVSHGLVDELGRLGPFGNGNPRPLIACRGVTLTAPPRAVGKKGEHVQLYLRQGETMMKAIAFNAAGMLDQLNSGKPLDLAVQPTLNEWNGRVSVELEVKDIVVAE